MIQARREGFALAATILAMLVVGAIVTGGFYAASQEGQVARSLSGAEDALYIAETGLNQAMATTNATQYNQILINGSVTRSAVNVSVGSTVIGNYVIKISRVDNYMFLIESTGTQTRGGRYAGASRKVAAMARLRVADFDNQAAVMIYGNLSVGGTSDIDGGDTFPAGWVGQGCTAMSTGTSAVLTNPTTTVTTSGSGSISGPVTRQTLTSGNFTVFGDMTWPELVAMRDIHFAGGGTVGPQPATTGSPLRCNTALIDNWGDPSSPTSPCFNYFPIIYSSGNLRISSSDVGQGILLVDGELDISGGFTFYGVVIVTGEIKMTGTGGHVNGTSMVFGGGQLGSTSSTVGNSLLQYSSCAIERATMNNNALARAVPIHHRSWIDLSAVTGGN